ncbi:MAG: hypothetical protein WCB62_08980, partial [Pseudolabrys sp.]
DDYFVVIKRCVAHRKTPQTRWTWGIQRRSKPLGVKFDGDKYATAQDARLAGETALKDLLRNFGRGWPDKPRLPTLEN